MRGWKHVVALAIAGALAAGAVAQSRAAAIPSNAAVLQTAASDGVVDVRWSRGWRGGWRGPGPGVVIGGIALGAAIAAGPYYGYPYAPYGYYGYPYAPYGYYGGPYWAGGYPGYWGSGSSVCWDRGRRVPCAGTLP